MWTNSLQQTAIVAELNVTQRSGVGDGMNKPAWQYCDWIQICIAIYLFVFAIVKTHGWSVNSRMSYLISSPLSHCGIVDATYCMLNWCNTCPQIRSSKEHIMRELEKTLQQQAPPTHIDNTLHELPPLVIDGIPTPVDKMTQVNICMWSPVFFAQFGIFRQFLDGANFFIGNWGNVKISRITFYCFYLGINILLVIWN